jgi:hypothetical protein
MPVSCCFLAASQCLLLMPLSCEHHLKQALPQPQTALPTHCPPPRLPALPAGYLQLDLVGAAAGATTTPIAKCLASVKVNLGSDCQVSLTPLSSGGSYVDGIWAATAGIAGTYKQLRECPVTTGAEETGASAAVAMQTAFENFVYGSGKALTATLAFTTGVVTVTTADGALTYAITKVRAPSAS